MNFLASLLPLTQSASALLLVAGLLLPAHAIAGLLFPTAPAYVRLCGTWVLGYWGMQTIFASLGFLGLFQLPVVLLLLLLAGLAIARWIGARRLWERLHSDWIQTREQLREALLGPGRWILGAIAVVLGLRLLRGLVAPPLGWDALTYHLFKAGRWVQTGAYVSDVGPDALRIYAYTPPGGDIVWAWAMLPFHSDIALAPAALLVWLSIVSAAFGLSRTMCADTRASFATALALGALPAAMAFLTSGYVDNIVIALVLLGSLFLVRAMREPTIQDSALAIAAFSACLCVKISAAPFMLLATLAILWSVLRTTRPWRFRAEICGVCLLMGAPFAPFYAATWIETGSPVFPWELVVAGQTIFEGMELVRVAAAGGLMPPVEFSIRHFLWLLFVAPVSPGWPFMNLGVGAVALLGLGIAGAAIGLRDPKSRWATAVLLLFAGSVLVSFMSPEMLAMRTHWAPGAGRLLLGGLAPLIVMGAVVPGRLPAGLRVVAVFAAAFQSFPGGFGEADRHHGMLAAGVVLAVSLLAALAYRTSRRAIGLRPAVALAVGVVLVGSVPLTRIRGDARYAIYEAAARDFRNVYDPHPLGPWRDAWPIWKMLDAAEPQRVAVVAGWSRLGDNWFRYPLLGSRLQNQVVYIPATRDGTIPDYRFPRELAPRLHATSWIRRLVDAEIDVVVALDPPTPERVWMTRNPEVFSRVAFGDNRRGAAFRFDRAAARVALRDAEGRPSN